METDIENRPMDMGGGEEGEGEMYGESSMETYNTICKIESQWEFAVWLGELKQGLCDNLEGWDGEGDSGGRRCGYTYDWFLLMFWQKTTKFCKAIIFQLKNKVAKK